MEGRKLTTEDYLKVLKDKRPVGCEGYMQNLDRSMQEGEERDRARRVAHFIKTGQIA